uniref:cyanophycinase n=1 Tax=Pedobacter schmidteae TaxID=2201271 RepID=UPI001D0209C5|nr:cyanophycinase [Pedobacter schmidteae]
MKKHLILILMLCACGSAMAQKGSLFIIGGGDRSPELIRSLIQTANMRAKDYMIVLPMSSGEPEASYEAIKKQLTAASKNNIGCLNFDASKVNDKKWLDSLTRARLIFITGGDQSRFMKVVLNTPVYSAIHKAYQNGATVAGTSAGAAVMSRQMITGKQLLDTVYKETFNKLWTGNIEFEQGMGLLDSVIIDQHFLRRSRFNRLISALSAYPGYQCIGIDEGTAIIVQRKKITVAGVSQVLRISDPRNLKTNTKGLIKMDDLRFSLYTQGDQFSLK